MIIMQRTASSRKYTFDGGSSDSGNQGPLNMAPTINTNYGFRVRVTNPNMGGNPETAYNNGALDASYNLIFTDNLFCVPENSFFDNGYLVPANGLYLVGHKAPFHSNNNASRIANDKLYYRETLLDGTIIDTRIVNTEQDAVYLNLTKGSKLS